MSFGLFESAVSSEAEVHLVKQAAVDKFAAAVYDVREKLGPALFASRSVEEFRDRVAIMKSDQSLYKVISNNIHPSTGTVRRIAGRNSVLEQEFVAKLAAEENDRPILDNDITYMPSDGLLMPKDDFRGYQNSVDQGGPEKVQNNFADSKSVESDFAKNAAIQTYADWCEANNTHPARMASLDAYSARLTDAQYFTLVAAVQAEPSFSTMPSINQSGSGSPFGGTMHQPKVPSTKAKPNQTVNQKWPDEMSVTNWNQHKAYSSANLHQADLWGGSTTAPPSPGSTGGAGAAAGLGGGAKALTPSAYGTAHDQAATGTSGLGGGAGAVSPSKPGGTVNVAEGDSLSGIADKNHVGLDALEGANPQFKSDFNMIHPNDKVNLPGGSGGTAGASPFGAAENAAGGSSWSGKGGAGGTTPPAPGNAGNGKGGTGIGSGSGSAAASGTNTSNLGTIPTIGDVPLWTPNGVGVGGRPGPAPAGAGSSTTTPTPGAPAAPSTLGTPGTQNWSKGSGGASNPAGGSAATSGTVSGFGSDILAPSGGYDPNKRQSSFDPLRKYIAWCDVQGLKRISARNVEYYAQGNIPLTMHLAERMKKAIRTARLRQAGSHDVMDWEQEQYDQGYKDPQGKDPRFQRGFGNEGPQNRMEPGTEWSGVGKHRTKDHPVYDELPDYRRGESGSSNRPVYDELPMYRGSAYREAGGSGDDMDDYMGMETGSEGRPSRHHMDPDTSYSGGPGGYPMRPKPKYWQNDPKTHSYASRQAEFKNPHPDEYYVEHNLVNPNKMWNNFNELSIGHGADHPKEKPKYWQNDPKTHSYASRQDHAQEDMDGEEMEGGGQHYWQNDPKTHSYASRRHAAPDYLQKADDALTQLLNQKAQEFQETIAPLQQALQTVQQAEQVAQQQNPLNVLPPAGTVNVMPGQDPGPMSPQDAMGVAAQAGGGAPPPDGGGGAGAPPPAADGQGALPPDMQMQARRRRGGSGKGRGAARSRQAGLEYTAAGVMELWNKYQQGLGQSGNLGIGGDADYEDFKQKMLVPHGLGDQALNKLKQHHMNGVTAGVGDKLHKGLDYMMEDPSKHPFAATHPGQQWKHVKDKAHGLADRIDDFSRQNVDAAALKHPHWGLEDQNRESDFERRFEGSRLGFNRAGGRPDDAREIYWSEGPGEQTGKYVPQIDWERAKQEMSPDEYDDFHAKYASRKQAWSGWGPSLFPKTRQVLGWEWDNHLNGYIANRAHRFACDCGDEHEAPKGFHRCKCGKQWNSYVIGTGGNSHEAAADKFLVREIPTRDGVIVANREMTAGVHGEGLWDRINDRQTRNWGYGEPDPTRHNLIDTRGYNHEEDYGGDFEDSRDYQDQHRRMSTVMVDPRTGKLHNLVEPGELGAGKDDGRPKARKMPKDWHDRNKGGQWVGSPVGR